MALAVVAVATVGLTVMALRASPAPAAVAAASTSAPAPSTTPTTTGRAGATTAPAAVASAVPGAVRALFLGDGLMAGNPASSPTTTSELTARSLGWTTTIDARAGSGFTSSGQGSYLARVTAALAGPERYDVVVVEGGANDVDLGPDPSDLGRQVDEVVRTVRANQPGATVVLVGVYSPMGAPVSAGSRALDGAGGPRGRPRRARAEPHRRRLARRTARHLDQQGRVHPLSGGCAAPRGPARCRPPVAARGARAVLTRRDGP